MKKIILSTVMSTLAVSTFLASPAFAKTWQVQMLNKDPDNATTRMLFKPNFLKIAPGDTVEFKATNKGHNSMAIKGMIPQGAKAWKGPMNKDFTVTLTKPGLYGYKCMPHFALGMVGLIQVGDDTSNLDAAKKAKLIGKSKSVFAKLFAKVKA